MDIQMALRQSAHRYWIRQERIRRGQQALIASMGALLVLGLML